MKNSFTLLLSILALGCTDPSGHSSSAGGETSSHIIETADNKAVSGADRDGDRLPDYLDALPDDPGGGELSLKAQFGSFLGGTHFERIQSVYIDDEGFIFLGGHTKSSNFPVTSNAYATAKKGRSDTDYDTADGFVAKLTPDGTEIIWATLIGGSRRDQVYAVRTDSTGNVYVLGATGSEDFPSTPGAYDPTFNGPIISNGITDIFVASLSPDGSDLRFSTFVGGSQGGEENPRDAFALDEKRGRLYVSGQTTATDFPVTKGAFQSNYGGAQDAFVFALSIDGSTLIASTLIGGAGSDSAFSGIKPHPAGDSYYIAGATNSPDFPTTQDVFQTTLASGNPDDPWWKSGDAFVARISEDLGTLVFSTLYGGEGADAVSHNQGVAVDAEGRVITVGHTESSDLPVTQGAFDTTLNGSSDAFIAVFTDTGALAHASYLGGSDTEEIAGVYVGPQNRIYVTGGTRSDDFPVMPGAYQAEFGNGASGAELSDAYLTIFGPHLQHVSYSSYLGGSGSQAAYERGRSIWISGNGQVLIGGVTDSADFPIIAPSVQPGFGGHTDGFIMAFEPLP